MGTIITDTRQLSNLETEVKAKVDNAILATAFKLRDQMREKFVKSKTIYKKATSKYDYLQEGIKVGHLQNGTVKVHALGTKQIYNSYKTRFFVGGTVPRFKKDKAYRGYIKSNNAVQDGITGGDRILTEYINNAINGK